MPHRSLRIVIRALAAVRRAEDVVDALDDLVKSLNVSVLAIWSAERQAEDPENADRLAYWARNVPIPFRRKFKELLVQYGPSTLAQHAAINPAPFTINEIWRKSHAIPLPVGHWIFSLLVEHGYHDGLYCPYGKWMVAYVSSAVLQERDGFNREVRYTLDAFGRIATHRLEGMAVRSQKKSPRTDLSPREQEVLTYMSEGYSAVVVAKKLNLSLPAVRSRIREILRKLEARNITHAATIATRRKIILAAGRGFEVWAREQGGQE